MGGARLPRRRWGERIHGPPTPTLSAPEPATSVAAFLEHRVVATSSEGLPNSAITGRRYKFIQRVETDGRTSSALPTQSAGNHRISSVALT